MGQEIIAVVAARGGSKRLPRKNIRRLGGVPLIGWSLAAARAAGFSKVWLTTEDEQIAAVGAELGFEVPFLRPAHLATDDVPAVHSLIHLADWFRTQTGWTPEAMVLLPPTAPFRPPSIVRTAADLMSSGVGRAVAMNRLHVPAGTIYEWDASGVRRLTAEHDRRQVGVPTGGVFAARLDLLRDNPVLLTDGAQAIPHGGLTTVDIDTEEDWAVAEALVANSLVRLPGT
jgi:N-acylneuraminate cytidylyltransferase/CMP-N,N'-diacetyllegionaminic acid synthase